MPPTSRRKMPRNWRTFGNERTNYLFHPAGFDQRTAAESPNPKLYPNARSGFPRRCVVRCCRRDRPKTRALQRSRSGGVVLPTFDLPRFNDGSPRPFRRGGRSPHGKSVPCCGWKKRQGEKRDVLGPDLFAPVRSGFQVVGRAASVGPFQWRRSHLSSAR